MTRFQDLSVARFVDALASAEPTPGGGTAAAVVGAMGAALLMMVAGMPKTRGNTDAERAELAGTRASLAAVRSRLLELADEDTEAYNAVMAAYRLPKSTDPEKDTRRKAIQQGLRAATSAPLDTLRAAVDAVGHAAVVARCGNPSASSDVRVAMELLDASAVGAAANVEINLSGLTDDEYRSTAASEVVELSNALAERIAAARSALAPQT